MSNNASSPAIGAYIRWLKKYQPYFYREIIKKYPQASQLQGMGVVADADSNVSITTDKQASAVTASWADTIKNLITTASQAYLTKEQIDAQKKLTDIQLERVRMGQAPLNIDPTSMGLPGPTVNFGVSGDVKKFALYGGIAAGALFLLSMFTGRRRHS